MQKSDDIFPGPLSLGSWNWKEKKNPNKKRKALVTTSTTKLIFSSTALVIYSSHKREIKTKHNYHTRPSKRCFLSRQAIFLVIFCLVGFFGAVFIYLFVFKSSLYLLPAPLKTPMTRGQDIISSDDKNKGRKVPDEKFSMVHSSWEIRLRYYIVSLGTPEP